MHPFLVLQLLALIVVANATPVFAKDVVGKRLAYSLDGGLRFLDGRPLFGRSKTIRGILLAILTTLVAGQVVGLGWDVGARIGAGAMAGDLLSSFTKRRLNLAPSSRATGLDQIPESLLPILACRDVLSISLADVAAILAIFFIGEILLSRLLYRLRLRDRPY